MIHERPGVWSAFGAQGTTELTDRRLAAVIAPADAAEGVQLVHSAAEAVRRPIESAAKSNRRIAELKKEMSSLGTPNLGAIDEYARVSERYEFLASQRDDAAHPAFQNLFVRTGRLGKYGVAAMRRPRDPSGESRRLWHLMATDASLTVLRVQTDRTAFLGRGRTIYAPRALEMPISASLQTMNLSQLRIS